MGDIAEQDQHQYVITIKDVKGMQEKIKEIPKLLNLTAGKESCCIFRVPQTLVDINNKAYHPQILSIGPYHHGEPHLNMIEEHKWKYLGELLDRTPPHVNGLNLYEYIDLIAPLETRIRHCYSEFIDLSSFDLIKMMVLDGLFINELISKNKGVAHSDPDDPIFRRAWILAFLKRDLLRLENQIPFFVLQTLFDNTRVTRSGDDDQTLAKLILGFFDNMVLERPDEVLERFVNHEGKHLLDFFRLSFIPPPSQPVIASNGFREVLERFANHKGKNDIPNSKRKGKNDHPSLQLIPSLKKLKAAGIKFKAKKGDTFSFLEIRFRYGVLEIPHICIDDSITCFFLNSVAFEQGYNNYCSMDMTAYTSFMGCLIKNPSDAGFLGDQEIIENYSGTDEELANFFNDLRKDVVFDIDDNYLSKVFEDVNEYQRNGWHVHWAGFKNTYFNTPWSIISALAALTLLLLTMIQAFFAVYPYAGGKSAG
ncbi:UPF0481 protein At3g47200-like [Rhododendron vialii]|uniref:UPF0481 protein At3g47200-like n=1 Tax=Rhododendron vialii TaxID=182163 RepID=UPI00265FCF65|nr:UPF0481 protein At3g47200-like [Rhododendron vialii]